MSLSKRTLAFSAGFSIVLAGAWGAGLAADDPAHQRHEAMETVQESFKPLRAIAVKEAWTDRAGFDQAMKDAQAAATAMAAVTEEAAYVPAMKTLGGSCKGCHDKYRLPKQ